MCSPSGAPKVGGVRSLPDDITTERFRLEPSWSDCSTSMGCADCPAPSPADRLTRITLAQSRATSR